MRLLKNIIEPKRLLIAWQKPDGASTSLSNENLSQEYRPKGKRYIVGELVCKNNREFTLHYFLNTEDFKEAMNQGFQGYPAFDISLEYHRNVFDIFARRIPPRSRSDFDEYLKFYRISPGVEISDFALLGYSGAKLLSDGFSLIHPFENVVLPCELTIEVAGFRYGQGMDKINQEGFLGHEVTIKEEPENEFDQEAIGIFYDDIRIGYINRGQKNTFHNWLQHNTVKAVIERINGSKLRPNVLLYVWVS